MSVEALEDRYVPTTFNLGDIAFTGYQATTPDKISFVLLKDISSGSVLTISDNAWTGSALTTNEGTSVITFAGNFTAGTQFNFDATRTAGARWAVGTATTNLSDATSSNFALNASGDNLFAYDGATAPSSGDSALWVSAFATNAYVGPGGNTTSLTALPSAFTAGDTAFTLNITAGASNENGAMTSPSTVQGTAGAVRATVYTLGNWTTFTTAGAQAVPTNIAFTLGGSNSPPAITAPATATTNEDASFAFTGTGNVVSISDPNTGDTLTVTLASTNGTLTANGTGVSNSGTASVTITGSQSVVNAALATLAFVPTPNFNGSATVTVNATDGTASAPQSTVTVTVNSVNDAPSGADKTVNTPQSTAYTFSAADFSLTDANDSPANALAGVVITTVPSVGTLALSGVPVTAGQFVPVATLGSLTYTPVAGASGTPYASFTFQVRDNGGTANSGADTDTTPNTITVNVTVAAPSTPAVAGFTPASGPVGSRVVITGTNFTGATAVSFNGTAASSFTVDSATQITAVVPAAATAGTISVTAPGGTVASAASFTPTNRVEALEDAAPVAISLAEMLAGGGVTYTVTQTNTTGIITPTLSGSNLTLTFAPNGYGYSYFRITATNGTQTVMRFLEVNVRPVDDLAPDRFDAPVGGGTVNLNVLANDGAPDTTRTVEAGNLQVVQNDTGNAATSVTVTFPQSTPDMQLRAGSNRGDYNIQIGSSAADDLAGGLLVSSVRENGRDNNEGTGVVFTTSAIDKDTGGAYFIPQFSSPGGAEYNSNLATAYFSYAQGWLAAWIANGAGTNGGANDTIVTATPNAGFSLSAGSIQDLGGGQTKVTIPGVNSQTDGLLVVVGAKNEDNYALARAEADGTWTVFVHDNGSDGASYEQDHVAFVYIPRNAPNVVSGRVLGDGTVQLGSGNATVVRTGAGAYTLSIPGQSELTGTLLLSPEGGVGTNVDNIVTYQASGGNFLIQTRDLPGPNLQSVGNADASFSFVFIPFLNAPPTRVTSIQSPTGTPNVSAEGATLTLNADGTVAYDTSTVPNYAARIAAGTFSDSFTYTTTNLNGLTSTTTVTVNRLAGTPTVADATTNEDTQTAGIVITGNTAAGDGTQFYKVTGIANGTLFLADGTTPVADGSFITEAQGAAGLKFAPATNFFGNGSFQVQAANSPSDAGLGGSVVTATVTVLTANDAPSGADKTVMIDEDATYTFSAADFSLTDANDSPANTLAGVVITTVPSVGTLALSGVPVTAGQFVPVATLGSLTYTPVAGASGAGHASFTFQVRDNGGTANGGVDTDPTANTITVNVTPVNDAPSGADKTVTTLEDTAYTFSTADFGFSDVDGNALAGVVITTVPSVGTLALSGVPVTAGQFVPVAALGSLTYTPALDANGAGHASFTFQVRDNSGSTDTDLTPNTITVNVTPVNDAPSGADKTVSLDQDTTYTFSAADFGLTDPNDSPANALAGVRITTLPLVGTLALSGVPVTAEQFIPAASIGSLTFTPVANANGSPYASFTFQVQDNGGIANGGVDTDPTANTITLNVNPANRAPSGADKAVTIDEDATYTFSAADFGFTDVDGDALLAVKITTIPSVGTLALSGVPVTAGQFVPVASLGSLTFTPALNASGAGHASFTFQVRDNGGTANGGVDTDPTANTFTVSVTPVNDVPTLDALMSVSGTVGVPQTVNLSGITAGGGESQGLTVTATSSTTAVVASPVSVTYTSPGATGALSFTPTSGGSTTITITVTDDAGTPGDTADDRSFTQTFTVSVNNLAPVNTFPTDVATNEDTPLAFTGTNAIRTDDPDDTLGAVTTVVSVPMGSGTLSSGAMSGTALTFTGTAAEVNAALADLVYTPPADANAATLDGSVTLRVTTTDGGGAVSEESAVRITVNPVNDAPSFTPASSPAAVNEDAGPQTATDFVTGISRGPVDESAQALTFEITGNTNAGLFSTAPAINAVGTLTFTPAPNAFGTATITYRLMDSGGTDNGGVEFSDEQTFTITVNPIPDAPTGTDATLTATEDGTLTLSAADFGFSDAIDAPADGFAGVVLTTLPTKGTLTLAGAAVTAGQFIAAADLGSLVFTPMPNGAGTGYASFTFQVRDDGSIANGGAITDPTPNTLTFDVAGINDEPSLSLNVDAFFVNQTGPFAQNGFAVFAPGGGADEAAQTPSFAVTVAPGGAALFAVQPVIDAAGRLTFTPAPGATGATTVTVTAFDGGSDGGANDAFSQSRTFSVALQVPLTGDSSGAVGGALNTAPAVATGAQLIAVGSAPGTPARVMVLDAGTGAVVRDFAPFGGFLGGLRVAVADVTGDGKDDLIVATASQLAAVAVFDGATGGLVNAFVPFGAFPGGAQIATGDVNGDGRADIVVGLDTGAPLIVALDGATGAVLRVFGGLPAAGGGTNMAVGDFTGDGAADVATAGAGGLVVVFDGRTGAVADAFFAVPGYTGDLNLAMGDVDGDGLSELVLGIPVGGTAVAGAFGRGGRLARVYSAPTGAGTPQPVAPGVVVSPAAQLAVADLDGDGFADLLVSTPPGAGLSQTVALSGKTGAVIRTATNPLFGAGSDVAAG